MHVKFLQVHRVDEESALSIIFKSMVTKCDDGDDVYNEDYL